MHLNENTINIYYLVMYVEAGNSLECIIDLDGAGSQQVYAERYVLLNYLCIN